MFQYNIKADVKSCDIYLISKIIKYKPYNDLQLLPILIYQQKDLFIDFITDLPISTILKDENQQSILVIIDYLTNIIYYEFVKITIDTSDIIKIIINIVIHYHGIFKPIITDEISLFMLKFRFLLYYFFDIKSRLSTTFYPQINGQIKR